MTELDSPRLLFVTPAAFNRVTGGGITFSNLFAGWPKDRLATVHCDSTPVSDDVCDRYYRLGSREIHAFGPLQKFRAAANAPVAAGGPSAPPSPKRRIMAATKRLVFGDSLPEVGALSPDLAAWIADFKPQVMYTILGSNGLIELVLAIHRRFNIPYAVHFMDDWIEAHHRRGMLGWIERRRMNRLVDQAVHGAARRLAICESMAETYARRWNVPFAAFQNTVDVARWSGTAKTSLTPGRPTRLLYTGSILPFAQLDSLAECCRAVVRLNAEGVDIRLDIHAPGFLAEPARARLEIAPSIRLLPPLTDDADYFAALAAADVLLLPANFDPDSVRFIRYSMPTKIPPYLLSGTPILVYGPPGIAQVDYARRHGWGHVVDKPGVESIVAGLKEILDDGILRDRVSRSAKKTAAARHDVVQVRGGFQKMLSEISRQEQKST